MQYVGRFAPTPSGPLHFGSLVTALASWLDARSQQGKWLLRIEDLDPPREEPGAATLILNTLEALGLTWDDQVLYQSQRGEAYSEALQQLSEQGLAYPCSCTRKELAGHTRYPGYCRSGSRHPKRPHAWRFAVDPQVTINWNDRVQGQQTWPLKLAGDVVIRRKDQLWAYQLAVVVDDLFQGVTHIVRGIDLLDSTPWQLALKSALAPTRPQPSFAHLPVIVNHQGQKLSKQNKATAISVTAANQLLTRALQALNQPLLSHWQEATAEEILHFAMANWKLSEVPSSKAIPEERLT